MHTDTILIRGEIIRSITAKLLLAWFLFIGNVAELQLTRSVTLLININLNINILMLCILALFLLWFVKGLQRI